MNLSDLEIKLSEALWEEVARRLEVEASFFSLDPETWKNAPPSPQNIMP